MKATDTRLLTDGLLGITINFTVTLSVFYVFLCFVDRASWYDPFK